MVSPAIVLVPLYIYPSAGAWNFLTQSINSYQNLQFQIIVNPDSGPGSSSIPDSSYIAGIAALNKHRNVKLLGYVHTSYASRAVSAVEKDISIYAGWAKYKAADIHMSGIFFDEVSSTASPTVLSYMNSLSVYTNRTLGSGHDYIIFNPGVKVDAAFYNFADMIVVWEDAYSPSQFTTTLARIPQSVRKKSGIIIHSFTGGTTVQTSVVKKVVSAGFGSLFITSQTDYNMASSIWGSFCTSMAT